MLSNYGEGHASTKYKYSSRMMTFEGSRTEWSGGAVDVFLDLIE